MSNQLVRWRRLFSVCSKFGSVELQKVLGLFTAVIGHSARDHRKLFCRRITFRYDWNVMRNSIINFLQANAKLFFLGTIRFGFISLPQKNSRTTKPLLFRHVGGLWKVWGHKVPTEAPKLVSSKTEFWSWDCTMRTSFVPPQYIPPVMESVAKDAVQPRS